MADPFLRDPVVVTPEASLAQRPEHGSTQLGAGQAPATLVLAHAIVLRDAVATALDAAPAPFRVAVSELFVSRPARGVGVCWPGVGAPAAALVLEKCIAAGTRRVLSVGFAGGLAPGSRAGDVVLVTGAASNDGVTAQYTLPGYRPAPDASLARALGAALGPTRDGPVWTTDAPYRETVSAVRRFRERGVVAVDMETAAILTVATYRSVPAAAALVVTDVIEGDTWRPCAPGSVDDVVERVARGVAKAAMA